MNRRYLDVRYDVTTLDDEEIGNLALEATVQAEGSTAHPSVNVESEVVEVEADTRTVLVHLNVSLPSDSTQTAEQVQVDVGNCLNLGLDNDYAEETTPALAEAVAWDVVSAEEV